MNVMPTLLCVFVRWFAGGAAQDEVEAQYGPISDWNAAEVTVHVLGLDGALAEDLFRCQK